MNDRATETANVEAPEAVPDPYDRGASNGEAANREEPAPTRYCLGPGMVPRLSLDIAEREGFAEAVTCVKVDEARVIYERLPDTKLWRVAGLLAVRHAGDALKIEEAIESFSRRMTVLRHNVVTTEDIAGLLNVEPATVRKWRTRHEDFPQPIKTVAKSGVWDWDEVAEWAHRRGHLVYLAEV